MVNGRGKRPSEIRNILGASRWIDVPPGRTIDKWSEAEGRALVRELERLVAAETETSPDIYCPSSDDLRQRSVFGSEALAHLV
jgi:hypothetical protein